MRYLASIIILATLWLSCKKEESRETGNLVQFGGLYTGVFSRTGMDTANVTISIGNNLFEGQSNRDQYPAICRGSYTTRPGSIVFVDSCDWTANFDWSLILNGTYNISSSNNDNAIRIWRTSGSVTDEYLLKKVVR